MSEVTLEVGGRPYTVSCADGEEEHVRHLAGLVDAKLKAMGGNRAPGDAKNLLFAALILADEAEEARRAPAPAPVADDAVADSIARGLEALAERLELVADSLEKRGQSA
ncbi:cell division protein ZapA [Qipengyuania sediminis]|uniref:cell division protein ZapA n=1 Tax=Qipengyuania sediminis TaxID=1532023 RepID=UPI001059AA94|nr:cell division protein ZapA [Qipengyuania sediminis]